jgi:transposase InsO family protein
VQAILRREGLGRLDRGDRATASEPPRRYQRERPGELVHVDVKKISGIPSGGGWRIHGRGQAPTVKRSSVGYRFIHTALDDRTRLAYSEIHHDEQAVTAAGFWRRAHAWFAAQGITVERALTDNGSCYRSRLWLAALVDTAVTPKRTRPYRPQTNGKVERFHRILLEEWAHIRPWRTDHQRTHAYDGFMHFYNRHRSHGALGWSTPTDTLARLTGDNLPGFHN